MTAKRPKLTFEELREHLLAALDAGGSKNLMVWYRTLSAMQRDGRVGRRRACPKCAALARPELSGEVIHAAGCALQDVLNQVEAFIVTGGRTRSIKEARELKGLG